MSIAREESSLNLIRKIAYINIIPPFVVRTSQLSDTSAMVSLSKAKRLSYKKPNHNFGDTLEKNFIMHKVRSLNNC
jgi:hypothetical protein